MKYLPSYESDYKTSSTRSEILQKLQILLNDPSFPFVGELGTDSFVLYEGGAILSAWAGKAGKKRDARGALRVEGSLLDDPAQSGTIIRLKIRPLPKLTNMLVFCTALCGLLIWISIAQHNKNWIFAVLWLAFMYLVVGGVYHFRVKPVLYNMKTLFTWM
jgi:hypothetical protein